MKRFAIMLVLLLAAAAVVQTAVAYGLALCAWEVAEEAWPQELVQRWPGPVPGEWKKQPSGIVVHPQRTFSMSGVAWDWQSFRGRGDNLDFELNVWRMGWPCRSLGAYRHVERTRSGERWREPAAWTARWHAAMIGGRVVLPVKTGDPPRVWPLYPIWSGFVLNTLIFAAVPAGMWLGAGWMRRARRRSRGWCVACGYDVAGLAKCPECGRGAESRGAADGQNSK